jgi:hypothetical protein
MEKLKSILQRHNLSLKKAFGQNFLTDVKLLDEIVEKAGKYGIVFEVNEKKD